MKRKSLFLAFAISSVACSCIKTGSPSSELVSADSAYMQGNHMRGDHLLAAYELQAHDESETEGNYYRLVKLEQAYMHGELPDGYYDTADSLFRYYTERGTSGELAKTLLFTGLLQYQHGDYPRALSLFLKAKDMAMRQKDTRLLCLICREIGDIYYAQLMLEECIPHYRQYYNLAAANHDTLRMAYGAHFMGVVSTINNDIDSIVYWLNKSIDLGARLPQRDKIVPYARCKLCDIYIQTEQYDKALELMTRDELSDANWAYWHYGQQHTDSAAHYFLKILERHKWSTDVEVLPILARLEEDRGNLGAAVAYYKQLAVAEDSLREQQRQESTRRIEAQYNYTSIKEQRDRLEQRNREMRNTLWLLAVTLLAVVTVLAMGWLVYRDKKQAARMRRQLLEKEQEAQQEPTPQQLEEHRRRREQLMEELKATALYQRLKSADQGEKRPPGEDEWQQLARYIDGIFNNLTHRLLALAHLSKTELHICYLLKLEVPLSDMAAILCKSRPAITQARRRMYHKLTASSGTAEQLDALIMGL